MAVSTSVSTREDQIVRLPTPQQSGGMPLLDALRMRRSSREFSNRALDLDVLSSLLWAAFGINRHDGHRTAPSARNWQEIDIYVAMKTGLYALDAAGWALKSILAEDLRAATGQQDFVGSAPLNLVYVADLSRIESTDRTEQRFFAAIDAGFISQNVYLFCASQGLATVVRGLVDRKALAQVMGLRPEQRIIVAQTVGYAATHG